MDLMQAVLSRRSAGRLGDPAPDDAALRELIQAAATAPDHGALRPWRLVLVRGEGRQLLGEAMARAAGDDPQRAQRARPKPLRAPLLVSIVFQPTVPHPKVPEWEQLAAVAGLVQTLHLLLHGRGWAAMWRTGDALDAPEVRECLGIQEGERLLGWLYVGTAPEDAAAGAPRLPVELGDRVRTLEPLPAAGPAGFDATLSGP
jgi:nitroreductase